MVYASQREGGSQGGYRPVPTRTGNMSNVKSVGKGVFEYRIDFGPGYRVYFGQESAALVILLGGGTKKRQSKDIGNAQKLWAEYKSRKKRR